MQKKSKTDNDNFRSRIRSRAFGNKFKILGHPASQSKGAGFFHIGKLPRVSPIGPLLERPARGQAYLAARDPSPRHWQAEHTRFAGPTHWPVCVSPPACQRRGGASTGFGAPGRPGSPGSGGESQPEADHMKERTRQRLLNSGEGITRRKAVALFLRSGRDVGSTPRAGRKFWLFTHGQSKLLTVC